MEPLRAKVIGVVRHRLLTDGDGVTTLVAFHNCPLRCKYCLNPQAFGDDKVFVSIHQKNYMLRRALTSFILLRRTEA